jgi:uncharacterized protein with ATP-grasp and redox domains
MIVQQLKIFRNEVLHGKVKPLNEDAEDVEEWNSVWQKYENKTWLELPWYFAESFFFRRLLEATGYFQPGPQKNCDPFKTFKKELIKESMPAINQTLETLNKNENRRSSFENLLHACLWGNRVDFSNVTEIDYKNKNILMERESLLINDFAEIYSEFERNPPSKIAFINDNVGMDLGFDIVLANLFLNNNLADKIIFYLKPYPFFVSDAIQKDLEETLNTLANSLNQNLRSLGEKMLTRISNGTVCISSDWFWGSPYHFPEMPKFLYQDISRYDLVISKGDANYRRLLSDRHWPFTTPIIDIIDYFPTSILILRTLKGEIIVGLIEGQAEKIASEDPDWLINGKRGIIQYVNSSQLTIHS